MEDKTQLELAIEEGERHKTPVSIKILIAILAAGLCVIGVYTFNIKQELLKSEQERTLLQENYNREKVGFLSRIKKLEAEDVSEKSD
ncbi:MAG: hypothetical protein ABFR82_17115 [Nitrospirota bacterium]